MISGPIVVLRPTAPGVPPGVGLPAGAAGPANSLSIGNVLTGPAGSAASATISGASPNQTLNLVIPKGDTGAPGSITSVNNKSGPSVTLSSTDVGAIPNTTIDLGNALLNFLNTLPNAPQATPGWWSNAGSLTYS